MTAAAPQIPDTPKPRNLTAERLREVLNYDPNTGIFTWRISRPGCVAGRVAGTLKPEGYRQIEVDGWLYRGARLAVLYMTGSWPPAGRLVDHRDGVRDNDAWDNLRVVTYSENARNRRATTVSGRVGVYPVKNGRWSATIWLNGRNCHLGTHDSVKAASAVRAAAERRHFGEYSRAASLGAH